MRVFRYRTAAVVAAVAMGLAACGGETNTDAGVESAISADSIDSDTASSSAATDPEAAAEANLPLLEAGETVVDHQVLNVADGSISTLGEVVDGDRPVLLWFFSPH